MPATRQATVKEAQGECDRLIQMVENVVVGRSDAGCWEFLGDFEAAANTLIDALDVLHIPLGDRLEYFRDFHMREHPSVRPFTKLGLPLDRDDCGAPFLDVLLGRTWLRHMQDVRDSLNEHKPSRSGPALKRGGGRKKDPTVIRLHGQAADAYLGEFHSLIKNGIAQPEALSRLAKLSAGDILRRINDVNDHLYPLRGPEADKFKKQVQRSPAYRLFRNPALLESPEKAPELLAKMNLELALEIGLRPTRARQN